MGRIPGDEKLLHFNAQGWLGLTGISLLLLLCNPGLCFPAGHRLGAKSMKGEGNLLRGGGCLMARDTLQGSAPQGLLSTAARKETGVASASQESLGSSCCLLPASSFYHRGGTRLSLPPHKGWLEAPWSPEMKETYCPPWPGQSHQQGRVGRTAGCAAPAKSSFTSGTSRPHAAIWRATINTERVNSKCFLSAFGSISPCPYFWHNKPQHFISREPTAA